LRSVCTAFAQRLRIVGAAFAQCFRIVAQCFRRICECAKVFAHGLRKVCAKFALRTYVAGPITSISKLQIRPSISKIFDIWYDLSIYSTSISKIKIFNIGYLRSSARYTKFELRYRINLSQISKQSTSISNNFDI